MRKEKKRLDKLIDEMKREQTIKVDKIKRRENTMNVFELILIALESLRLNKAIIIQVPSSICILRYSINLLFSQANQKYEWKCIAVLYRD